MTGLQTVVDLRRRRQKPGAVFVSLVEHLGPLDAERYALSDRFGNVEVNIAAADALSDIDLRPLHGLHVQLFDCAGDRTRFRRLAALIAEVEPALLVMAIADGDGHIVHIRRGRTAERAASTQTIRLG